MKKFMPIILLCALSACTEELPVEPDVSKDIESSIATKSASAAKEYEYLPNPYALDNMQTVYDDYGISTDLEPTDLYVRFMPVDTAQIHDLTYNYGLELFDYPLDINLEEGDVYVDPSIQEGDYTWKYTTVKTDFDFPKDIKYEILEECYIPDEGEEFVVTKGGETVNVEEAAFLSLGYTLEDSGIETKARRSPQGTITVKDDYSNKYVPVKGVKIRCHTIVKWATAYTDDNGTYKMGKKFLIGPHYGIVFENIKDFDLWDQYGPIAKANYSMGWHSNKGYSKQIDKGNSAWARCAVNNAGYEYYQMCEQTGIPKPPATLKIWLFNNIKPSSAPMLRRIEHSIGINGENDWINFFVNFGYGSLVSVLHQMLRFVMPDITIGTLDKEYNEIYENVNHELSHASHFSTVGSEFWAEYISYIITYGTGGKGAYGDGTGRNAELCGVGEMWGYFMGFAQESEKFTKLTTWPIQGYRGWIKPGVFGDLYDNNVLTKRQIYDCLTADVRTYDALVSTMCGKYPLKADAIAKAFDDNDIDVNVEKPGNDASCINMTISSPYTISGENVLVKDSKVINGAKLTVHATGTVTIDGSFTVNPDSGFEITHLN